jgi:hypothetical protein
MEKFNIEIIPGFAELLLTVADRALEDITSFPSQ